MAAAAPPFSASETIKKLSRYCCAECGAKELFLYCWKGCRHIQGMKTFYLETRAVHQELDTLKETIYDQELRLRELEAEVREKHQSLQFLLDEVRRLPVSASSTDTTQQQQREKSRRSLPDWALVGVKMIWSSFDADLDGELTDLEWLRLKDKLSASHNNIEKRLSVESPANPNRDRSPQALLSLYEGRGGAAHLQSDLKALGIAFGSDETLANSIAKGTKRLAQFTMETQALQAECSKLQSEVHEKARAATRLREAFAMTKAALDTKDAEIARIEREHEQADARRREASARADEVSRRLGAAEKELGAATHAVIDLRALVEDQVGEKEKWQRYCWELEERLHDAMHASQAQERDLWRTRDAKKEEARKNMLLYMDTQRGRRHFRDADSSQELAPKDEPLD